MRPPHNLVERARKGDRGAQNDLFDRCWLLVWPVAYAVTGSRSLAEDAAQEAIVSVFRNLGNIDPERPLEPWLHRVAANAALSELRRQKRRPASLARPEVFSEALEPDSETGNAELVRAVAALPEERRLIVVLHYWLDYSVAQIAELLELPAGTVASRASRALQELRLRMEEQHAHSA